MPENMNYVDWGKLPDWVKWVACDDGGEPWMFPDKTAPVISEHHKWWTRPDDGDRSLEIAIPANLSAIVGPLPPWRNSLRQRPKKEGSK